MKTTIIVVLSIFQLFFYDSYAQDTYAEKLGFPKGAKVLILHVDDAGMSWDSNEGAKQALSEGVATSVSVMMPTVLYQNRLTEKET